MENLTDPTEDQPDTIGAPTQFADAAEAPQWIQTAAKTLAFLPAALSVMSIGMVLILGLVICLVAVAVLVF